MLESTHPWEEPTSAPHATVSRLLSIERRATVRYPCDLLTSHATTKGNQELCWWGQVRDISTNGIGLLVCQHIKVGALLSVQLHKRDESVSREVLVRVIRIARQDPPWDCLLGCEFVEPLTEPELEELL